MTTDGNVHIQTNVLVYHTEWHRCHSSVLIADQFLNIHIVNSLLCGCHTTKADTLTQFLKGCLNILTQAAIEQAWLCTGVIQKLSCLCTHIYDLPLIHNQHTLSICHTDDRTIGDHVAVTAFLEQLILLSLVSSCHQNICRKGITVKIISPGIGQYAGCGCQCCTNQTHISFLLV